MRACLALVLLLGQAKPAPRPEMEYGPFLSSSVSRSRSEKDEEILAYKGISIKVAKDATVLFDTELLRMSAGWTGGFLDFSDTHQISSKGSLPTRVKGTLFFTTSPGPGWGVDGDFSDARPGGRGPLPRERARYRGLYVHGDRIVLSYDVGGCPILEMPGFHRDPEAYAFLRTFRVGETKRPLTLRICDAPGALGPSDFAVVTMVDDPPGADLTAEGKAYVLKLSPSGVPRTFTIALWARGTQRLEKVSPPPDPASLCAGCPPRWTPAIETKGARGRDDGPYAVDTLTLPEKNPWGAWMRLTGVDFFSDGRAAVSTWNGDVWVVSGIDAGLEKLVWKRFAAGLYEPLGLRIVEDKVHVLGRDQITRLHDLNGDGEADFYENFNNDQITMPNYHAFAYDLQTDPEGNFYYGKGGHRVDSSVSRHCGIFKVSKDGKTTEQLCTGLRAPNGLGVGPGGEVTCSDQQGNWTPTSRLNWVKKGGFYGYVPHSGKAEEPKTYDPPLCWLPYGMDPSSGGQVWVTSDRWGPYAGQLLHFSYGTASLIHVLVDRAAEPVQGGLLRFPLVFASGIMRGRFHPGDGQLYVCGLRGWQTAGTRDGCLQRVRYTGRPVHTLAGFRATRSGLELSFTHPLRPDIAADPGNYAVQVWNYIWSEKYGSAEYSVANPRKQGRDTLEVTAARLSPDGKTVTLDVAGLRPVHQLLLKLRLRAADASPLSLDFYATLHRLSP